MYVYKAIDPSDKTNGYLAKHNALEFDETTKTYTRPSTLALQVTIEVSLFIFNFFFSFANISQETFDNDHRVRNQRMESQGDFTFTAADSGEHRICYRALSGGWFHPSKVKVYLDVAQGSGSHIDSSNSKKLNTLADRVRDINNKMGLIKVEQHLMREREAQFRNQSESTNASAVKWSIIQLAVLGLTCVWQLHHLRGFFMKQKLV